MVGRHHPERADQRPRHHHPPGTHQGPGRAGVRPVGPNVPPTGSIPTPYRYPIIATSFANMAIHAMALASTATFP